MQAMSLQVNGPWSGLILNGTKTVETSGQPLTRGGSAPGLVYLRDQDGVTRGTAILGERFEYLNLEQFRADFPRHRVKPGDPFDFGKRARTWGFPVLETRELPRPMGVRTPRDQRRFKPVLELFPI